MDRKKEVKSPSRRDFLKAGGLASGTLGIAAVGLSPSMARTTTPHESVRGTSGYRETEHVRTYYELARI